MINKVTIENFKGFQSIEINNLRRVNLISGMNNTGKTSLLEAIFLFHDRVSPDAFLKPVIRREVQQFDLTPEFIFHTFYSDFNFKAPFKIIVEDSGHKGIASYSLKPKNKQTIAIDKNNYNFSPVLSSAQESFEVMEVNYLQDNKQAGTSKIQINNGQLEVNFESVVPANKIAVFVPSSSRGNAHNDAQFISNIDIMNGMGELTSYLQMVDSRLNSISLLTISGRPAIYVDIGLKRKIPMSQMGEGISKLTSILAAILSNPNSVIMIDEIENGIHYSLMPKLWGVIFKASQSKNCQIFATTHSHDVLQGVSDFMNNDDNKDYEKSFTYIRLDKDKNGIVTPKTYSTTALITSIERDWDIR